MTPKPCIERVPSTIKMVGDLFTHHIQQALSALRVATYSLNQSKVERINFSQCDQKLKGFAMSEVTTIIPPQLVKILDRPPLCVGEDRGQYDQLRNMLLDEIKPTTVTECLLVYDIADAEWELLRLHGFKAGMINAHMQAILKNRQWSEYDQNKMLGAVLKSFRQTFTGNPDARKKLDMRLERQKLTLADVAAYAYENNIAAQIQTDHMINAALQRREGAYAELERRRSNHRKQSTIETPKRIAAAVVDGEFSPMPADETTSEPITKVVLPSDSTLLAPTEVTNDRDHPSSHP